MTKCKKVQKVIGEMKLFAASLGVEEQKLWDTHAEVWHECWDCGVGLSDSKIHSDPTCPACGRVWSMG